MGNTRTVVMSGHRVGGFAVRRSVRPYLTSSVAVATAGILAAGFVAGPPEVTVARTKVQGMQLIAIALPSTTPRPAMPMNSVRKSRPIRPIRHTREHRRRRRHKRGRVR